MPKMYGWVHEVVPESPADAAGVQPGDLIHTINGQPIRDLVDFRFAIAEEHVTLGIRRLESEIEIALAKPEDADLGVIFGEEPAPFIRVCANKCVFCFIDGLPKRHAPQRGLPIGMRDSLYIKDDDYRYSFLFGNFITLTNMKDRDWQRLEEQRLSPLYVSVHATEPELRRQMVDGPRAGEILDHIERLGRLRIVAHTQLVLCPEMNDGEHLDRSIADLAALRPVVASIAVVPVGLTKYNNLLKVGDLPALRTYRGDEAQAIVRQVRRWQRRFERELGEPFVLLSDEWYFLTDRAFPPASHYGDFAQIENGVGMTRRLLNDWSRARRHLPPALPRPTHVTLVTSTMPREILADIAAALNQIDNLQVDLLIVENRFFGPLVTVAGLLCGHDVLDAIAAHRDKHQTMLAAMDERIVLLPRIVLDNAGQRFLDDVTAEEFQRQVGDRVVFARDVSEVMELLAALAQDALPDEPVLIGER
jgi:putative radical SAM enzyme (TIGR03279 family)